MFGGLFIKVTDFEIAQIMMKLLLSVTCDEFIKPDIHEKQSLFYL